MDSITIYLPDGKTLLDAPITDKAQRNATLMTDNSVTLQWYSELGPYLPALSYIEWDCVRFILPEDYTPTYSGGIYDYQPKFLAREYALSAPLFCRYITITDQATGDTTEWEEASFSVNANLATMAQMIEAAISRCGLYAEKEFALPIIKDAVDPSRDYLSTPTLPFSFEGVSILEAITQAASAFSREWWVEDDCRLYFAKCERKGDPIPMSDIVTEADFALSSCETATSSTSCPRYLKVYGSDRNITPRKAQANGMNIEFLNRLRLDNDQSIDPSSAVAQYVRVRPDSRLEFIGVNNLRTELFIDEDIYPRYIGTVHSVITKDNGKTDPAERRTYYTIIDSSPSFPATIEKVTDENRRLVFTSGNLNGLEFDFNYNPTNKEITIISNSDNGGILLPTEAMCPKIGDTFVMFNIRMDDTYIATAKAELLAKATLRCAELLDHIPSVRCTSDDLAFADRRIELQLGTPVILHTPSVRPAASAASRVQSISYPLTRPTSVTFLLSNTYLRGRLDQLRDQIRQAEDAQRPLVERAKRISDDGIVSNEERATLRVMESQITARAKEIQDRCRQNDIDHADYLTALGNVLSLLAPILSSEGDYPINRTEFDTLFTAYNQAEQSIATTLARISEPNIISTDPDDWEDGGFNDGTGKPWQSYRAGYSMHIRLKTPVANGGEALSLKKWYKTAERDHTVQILAINDKWQVVENVSLYRGAGPASYTTPSAWAFIISLRLLEGESKERALTGLALRGMRAYGAFPPYTLSPDFLFGIAVGSLQDRTAQLSVNVNLASDTAGEALAAAREAVSPALLADTLTPYAKTSAIRGTWQEIDLRPAEYDPDTFYAVYKDLGATAADAARYGAVSIEARSIIGPDWGGSAPWSTHATKAVRLSCQWTDSAQAWGAAPRVHNITAIDHAFCAGGVPPIANIGNISQAGVIYCHLRGGCRYQIKAAGDSGDVQGFSVATHPIDFYQAPQSLAPIPLGGQTPPTLTTDTRIDSKLTINNLRPILSNDFATSAAVDKAVSLINKNLLRIDTETPLEINAGNISQYLSGGYIPASDISSRLVLATPATVRFISPGRIRIAATVNGVKVAAARQTITIEKGLMYTVRNYSETVSGLCTAKTDYTTEPYIC